MRRRLVVAIVAVAAASVVLFAIPLAITLRNELRDQQLLRLQRDAIAATRAIDLPGQPGDPVEVPRSSDRLAVYDPSARRIAGTGPPVADASVVEALRSGRLATARSDARLVVAAPVLSRERVIAALRASRSTSGVDAAVRRRLLVVLAIGLGVILLAGVAALAVARRLTRPLDRLAGAAARLGEGDFTARAPRAGVPELDAVAATLDATAARLDDLLQRERSFSADASHQLRTPLAALRLELEALGLEGVDVRRPIEQVERLQATIDTLLAIARDQPRDRAEIELISVVDAFEPAWRSRLAAGGRPLRVLASAPHVRARVAPAVVEQVLDVLVDNAHRHGSGEVTVTVREAPGGSAIDVTDAGPGLDGDPEAAFVRRAGSGNGHGIGLALARSLAQAEGGDLVVSHAGPHPVFTLLLSGIGADADVPGTGAAATTPR